MADETKKPTHGVKGFVVRSLESNRNRAGYRLTSTKSYIDVTGDELTDEEVDAIRNDPSLVAVEVESAPKGVDRAQRYNADGKAITGEKRAAKLKEDEGGSNAAVTTPLRNSTLETATEEMLAAAKKGEEIPPHPSAPGSPARTSPSPEAARERFRELEAQGAGEEDEVKPKSKSK